MGYGFNLDHLVGKADELLFTYFQSESETGAVPGNIKEVQGKWGS